jgi:hypothetical protein
MKIGGWLYVLALFFIVDMFINIAMVGTYIGSPELNDTFNPPISVMAGFLVVKTIYLFLFFKKKKTFKPWFISYCWFYCLFFSTKAVIGAVVFTAYLLLSKRSKETFVN